MFATTISPAGEQSRRQVSPDLAFALLAGLAAYTLAALSPAILNDSDTYWHILSGSWMLDHRAVLRGNVFSYTAAGAPVSTQSWLAEIVMAWAFGAARWAGIHALFGTAAGEPEAVASQLSSREQCSPGWPVRIGGRRAGHPAAGDRTDPARAVAAVRVEATRTEHDAPVADRLVQLDVCEQCALPVGRDHTVLFIEHNMGIVMNISDTVTVMRAGQVLVEGRPAEVRDDPEVRRAYLGNMITGDLR